MNGLFSTSLQPDLFAQAAKPLRGAERVRCLAAGMVRELKGQGWRPSVALQGALEASDREVRKAAESLQGAVISGQKGYCLLEEATVEEAEHAANWLISQGRKMIKRGVAMRSRVRRKGL